MKKLFATLLIGLYLMRHLALRWLGKLLPFLRSKRSGEQAFADNYRADGIVSLPPESVADLAALQGCIRCELCDALCDRTATLSRVFFNGPSLLASTHSRCLPDLAYARSYRSEYAACGDCERCMDACPTGVPLKRIVELMDRMTPDNP